MQWLDLINTMVRFILFAPMTLNVGSAGLRVVSVAVGLLVAAQIFGMYRKLIQHQSPIATVKLKLVLDVSRASQTPSRSIRWC